MESMPGSTPRPAPPIVTEKLRAAGEELTLLSSGAVWWPAADTLLAADLHLGKDAVFRSGRIPVPTGSNTATLARLDSSLRVTAATRLVLLGDIVHDKASLAPHVVSEVAAWRDRWTTLAVLAIRGNHDRRAGLLPSAWRIELVDEPHPEPPFVWRHTPRADSSGYVLAGHIHPAVRVQGTGGQSERLPCFWFTRDYAVLPALGGFTGTALVRPRVGDRVVAIAEDALAPLTELA